eukprot:sb/3469078/
MDTKSDTINVEDINCWGSVPSPQPSLGLESGTPPTTPDLMYLPEDITTELDPAKGGGGEGQYFQTDTQLNSKIAVWCGSIAKITADACVLPCTELLRGRQPAQSRAVFRGCTTGDVKMYKTTTLPYKYVMLTPGPKYTTKYESASEITLVSCYKNALILALEHGLETLVIGRIHTEAKGYPNVLAVNIALRVTRLFLEQHGDLFKKICFVLETSHDLVGRELGYYLLVKRYWNGANSVL